MYGNPKVCTFYWVNPYLCESNSFGANPLQTTVLLLSRFFHAAGLIDQYIEKTTFSHFTLGEWDKSGGLL